MLRNDKLIERRRYIRLDVPVKMTYVVPDNGKAYNTATKNISAEGLRFETHDKYLKTDRPIELKLDISESSNPVHAKARIIWMKKLSLEDSAPYNVGVEFTEIEEDNKNTFLKFLCDLIYNLSRKGKND